MINQQKETLCNAFDKLDQEERAFFLDLICKRAAVAKQPPKLRLVASNNSSNGSSLRCATS